MFTIKPDADLPMALNYLELSISLYYFAGIP